MGLLLYLFDSILFCCVFFPLSFFFFWQLSDWAAFFMPIIIQELPSSQFPNDGHIENSLVPGRFYSITLAVMLPVYKVRFIL
jgi:hypothetical protein